MRLLLPLLFFCLSAQAQLKIEYSALHFSNDFEKAAFEQMKDGNPDYLALFIASSGRGNQEVYEKAEGELNRLVEDLNPEKFRNYKGRKKIKKLFELVNDKVYTKYQVRHDFISNWEDGSYNCVTASAINGLMLEKLNIPYSITEEPNHVYVIAKPDDELILMESTDPVSGYMPLTSRVWERQIQSLISAKIITEDEVNTPVLDSIIKEMYPSTDINLLQLVAIQYYNLALYDLEDGKSETALDNFMKAYYIYPSDRIHSGLLSSLSTNLLSRDYAVKNYARNFIWYTNSDTSSQHYQEITNEFYALCYNLLNEDQNPGLCSRMADSILPMVNDSVTRTQMSFDFHMLNSLQALQLGEYRESYKYGRKAMSIKSDNLSMITTFTASIAGMYMYADDISGSIDTMDRYIREYSTLKENLPYNRLYAEFLMRDALNEIITNRYTTAEKRIIRFEELQSDFKKNLIPPGLAGVVYSRMALHYFNQSKSRAMQAINRGLELAPDETELLKVRSLLN